MPSRRTDPSPALGDHDVGRRTPGNTEVRLRCGRSRSRMKWMKARRLMSVAAIRRFARPGPCRGGAGADEALDAGPAHHAVGSPPPRAEELVGARLDEVAHDDEGQAEQSTRHGLLQLVEERPHEDLPVGVVERAECVPSTGRGQTRSRIRSWSARASATDCGAAVLDPHLPWPLGSASQTSWVPMPSSSPTRSHSMR